MTKRIIFTGPPSAGKTSSFEQLKGSLSKREKSKAPKVNFFPEISREIIRNSKLLGLDILPDVNPEAFNEAVATGRVRDFHNAVPGAKNFYDRSIVDTLTYARVFGCSNNQLESIAQDLSHNITLGLFFPFEPSIYTTDAERTEDAELAQIIGEEMEKTYKELKIELVTVPFMSLTDRNIFIIQELGKRGIKLVQTHQFNQQRSQIITETQNLGM